MTKLTPKQAWAFVDALVGWESVADQQIRPNSPHARTHLQAALGINELPSWSDMNKYILSPNDEFAAQDAGALRRANALLDYLAAVVAALSVQP